MKYLKFIPWMLLIIITAACGNRKGKPSQQEVVQNVQQLDEVVPQQIAERLEYVEGNEGWMEDSVPALSTPALRTAYACLLYTS